MGESIAWIHPFNLQKALFFGTLIRHNASIVQFVYDTFKPNLIQQPWPNQPSNRLITEKIQIDNTPSFR